MSHKQDRTDRRQIQVGVVMTAYNERGLLDAAVGRLLKSTTVDHVVVVDASDDEPSRRIAEHLKHGSRSSHWHSRLTILTGAAKGRASQMNAGAKILDTDVLLFQHVDTVLPKRAIELIRSRIEAGAEWGRFDVRIDDPSWIFRIIESAMNQRSAWTGICTGDQSIFVTSAKYQALGGFASIALMEDVEFCKRLKQSARPVRLRHPVLTSARRWRKHGVFRTMSLMWMLRFSYWLGVSPDTLSTWYRQNRPQPAESTDDAAL